jgi:hypothetical protein
VAEFLSGVQDKDKGVYVAGAKEHPVDTEDELLQVMQVGFEGCLLCKRLYIYCVYIFIRVAYYRILQD